MASLIENLVGILNSENEIYEKILKLSKDKTGVIVAGDIKLLEMITEKEQLLTNEIQKLEKEREKIMNDIGVVVKKEKHELTISSIISMLSTEYEEQEKIKEAQAGIQKTLNQLRTINIRNTQLIKHSLEMIQFDLNLFKSMRQAPETANYNKSAYSTGDLLGGSGFDTKQ